MKRPHLYRRQVFTPWQLLTGPAHLVDAIVETFTFGFYASGLTVKVSRRLLMAALVKKKAARDAQ